jgi:hypothetical protein
MTAGGRRRTRAEDGNGKKGGLFWQENARGEQKLLELADGLLTTTGCGSQFREAQQV